MAGNIKITEVLNDLDEIINNVVPSQEDGFRKLQLEIVKLRSKYKYIDTCVAWNSYT